MSREDEGEGETEGGEAEEEEEIEEADPSGSTTTWTVGVRMVACGTDGFTGSFPCQSMEAVDMLEFGEIGGIEEVEGDMEGVIGEGQD